MHGPCLRVCSYLSSPPPLQPAPLQARRVPGECACEVGAGSAAGLNPRSATCTTVHLPLLPPMEHAGLRGEHAGPQHLQGAYTQKPHRVPSMRARTHTHACMQGDSRLAESWLLRAPALPHTHAPTHTHRLTRASSAPSAAALWRATTCWTGERSAAQRSRALVSLPCLPTACRDAPISFRRGSSRCAPHQPVPARDPSAPSGPCVNLTGLRVNLTDYTRAQERPYGRAAGGHADGG